MKFASDYVVLFWFGLYRTESLRDDLRMRAILGGGGRARHTPPQTDSTVGLLRNMPRFFLYA